MKHKIKKVKARDHILRYPDAYLGSVSESHEPRLGYSVKGLIYVSRWVPAAITAFKEVLDNSLDAAIRSKFKSGCNIKVTFSDRGFSVEDDGHGLPIVFDEKENMWAPQLAFAEERAGSNFDVEDRATVGMFGIGVFVTNVVSTSLELITCDSKKLYSQSFGGNCGHISTPVIDDLDTPQSGTVVSVELDPDIIRWSENEIYCCAQLINNVMFVYPEINISINILGDDIDPLAGEAYYKALGIEEPWFDISSLPIRGVFGYFNERSLVRGLVNGTECTGLHVSTFKSMLSTSLINLLSREIEGATRGDISKVISGVLSFRVLNPAFGGLTKNELTGGDVDTLRSDITGILPELTDKLMNCEPFLEAIRNLVSLRSNRKLKQKERKAAKSRKSLKLIDVYRKGRRKKEKTYLLITEGDSAKGLFVQARDPQIHAIYPLRGKILNTIAASDIDTVSNNKVLFELSTILGLSLTDHDISSCRYDYIVSLTDADVDGASITGLLIGFIYEYWPQLFDDRRVLRLLTPTYIDVYKDNREHYYGPPPKKIRGHLEYIKGLASLTIDDVKRILERPVFELLVPDVYAGETINTVLGKSAEEKRKWLSI